MSRLIRVRSIADIPAPYRGTPIGRLLEYHNLGRPQEPYAKAELLVGMCMDNRKHLRIPENFAFVLRSGGANLRHSEFKVSYALAVGGVRAVALIGHDDCGMVDLASKEELFVKGLVGCGWPRERARRHFREFAPQFQIGDEMDFLAGEAARLRTAYSGVLVAPLLYRVGEAELYVVGEPGSH